MIDELPTLTTWQRIGLVFAMPSYNDGAAYLDEGDMADIAQLLDEYKAERDAEVARLREQVKALRAGEERIIAEHNKSVVLKAAAVEQLAIVRAERNVAYEQIEQLRSACNDAVSNLEAPIAWRDRDSEVAAAILRGALDATE